MAAAAAATVPRKWWKEEIVEVAPTPTTQCVPTEEKPLNDAKLQEVIGSLMQLGGPTLGEQYKIEVTGPLSVDGTFWACPMVSGFIQEKLEPLSNLLRNASKCDECQLDDVSTFNGGAVFVHSMQNRLWMRGVIQKNMDKKKLKVQLIDVGRFEDHEKTKVFKLPEKLAQIPSMALHCSLFQEKTKIAYEDKWRFNDLVKKKVLNFTCEGFVDEEKKIIFGKMESIVEKPIVDINAEMKKFIEKRASGETLESFEGLTVSPDNAQNGTSNGNEMSENEQKKTDVIIGLLKSVSGAKLGVNYKIEVTSALNQDGTFWACPVTSGFVKERLEPLSNLIRSAIQRNPTLRKSVEDFTGLVCVQSKENKLMMRGVVSREIDNNNVKLQLIDMGRAEDHPKSKVFRCPESLTTIPYMAFHCTLFEEEVKLKYEIKWKFNDLCKRKVLNLKVNKFIEHNKNNFVFGEIAETMDDKVDVIEAIRKAIEDEEVKKIKVVDMKSNC